MTRPDDDLQAYADRWRAAQPDPVVDWDAVTRRRRPGRWVPVAVGTALALVVAGVAYGGSRLAGSGAAVPAHRPTATPTPSPAGTPLAYDVPWVDRPAPPPSMASPLPVAPLPADARPCTAADLTVASVMGNQISETLGPRIEFRNTSASTCLLAGVPAVTASGTGVRTEHRPADPTRTDSVFGVTANMAPGESTALVVTGSVACSAGVRVMPTYTSLDVAIPGGGTVHVDVSQAPVAAICPPITVYPFSRPAPDVHYAPQPLAGLTANLTLPGSVHAGDTLTYVVTLTNPTGKTVAALPCPGYIQSGGDGGVRFKRAYALNCDTVHAFTPGRAVRYQMKVTVPADAPTGTLSLGWDAATFDGPTAQGTVHVVGNDHPCQAGQLAAAATGPGAPFRGNGIYDVKDAGTALTVTVTNTSDGTCTLQGAPTVALADADGKPLPVKANNTGFGMAPPPATPLVQLPPGGTATVTLSWHTRWCAADPNPVTVGLTLPASGGTLTLHPTGGWTPPGCTGSAFDTVSSEPFRP